MIFLTIRAVSYTHLLEKLKEAGVITKNLEEEKQGDAFLGETVVLTGKLNLMGRREASDLIKKLGGATQSSITNSTTLVIACLLYTSTR